MTVAFFTVVPSKLGGLHNWGMRRYTEKEAKDSTRELKEGNKGRKKL
jgi:hypothetical protein